MFWFNRRKKTPEIAYLDKSSIERLGNRRHLKNIPYLLPKDLGDQNRLDLQHFMLRHALHGNFLAPISSPQRILDVGCGTGRWGAEMARDFPQANVIGFDLEPPISTSNSIRLGEEEAPNNYSFVKGDVKTGLPFSDNSFDFVHMRMMLLALPQDIWSKTVQEMMRVTKPTGWIELVDAIGTDQVKTPAWRTFYGWLRTISAMRKLDLEAGLHLGDHLRFTGLKNVQHYHVDIPIGQWGGSGGVLMATDYEAIAKGLKGPITQMGIASQETFDSLFEQMVRDIQLTRSVQPFYVAFGQKIEHIFLTNK